MAFAFVILSVIILILLMFFLIKKYTYWKRQGIPTVRGTLPFVGHMLPVLTTKLNYSELNRKMHIEYKNHSMVGYYKLTNPVLLIRDPYLAGIVLKSKFSCFQRTGVVAHPDIDPLLARNAFFVAGEEWANARRRLINSFTNVKLKTLLESINVVCKKMEDYIDRRLQTTKKYETELKTLCSKFTGEVIANVGVGVEGYCFDEKPHPAAFDRIGDWLFKSNLKQVLEMTLMFTPGLKNSMLKMKFIPEKMESFFRDIVSQNLKIRRQDSIPRSDILQSILDYLNWEKEEIDEELIASDVLSFYMDGYETSAVAISFTAFLLAQYPEVQDKLRREIMSKIEKYDGAVTFEGLREMTYMDQVINETQRRYTSISFLTRVCTEECELRGSDGLIYRVEPGMEVIVSNQGFHLDPEYWPDPELFDPERFSEERKHTIEKLAFLPFGEGPRLCAGMKMAQLQLKSFLTTLISKYRLELSEKTQLPIKLSGLNFLTEPIGGLWVHISKI
ncbi:probable cytochrome P450 6a13 [Osmia bicornis bicornis]|uniref:probable cytochrome P450 6a13 n=1 Tax=Osmia bicornis bicornis TaxID=1437191 RepID=UPI0010F7772A|nr:probable cytochrome P450 6a13 [Osmia bicornis bicornis]